MSWCSPIPWCLLSFLGTWRSLNRPHLFVVRFVEERQVDLWVFFSEAVQNLFRSRLHQGKLKFLELSRVLISIKPIGNKILKGF